MTDLNRDFIEVFRAGDYGEKGKWTVADLDRLAESYDPGKHAAPVVIGHPADDAPAYGWVKKLRRAGESLWAQLSKVAPEFENLVRQGRFIQRSVALYKTFPLTGGPYLRHLGFLGAQPPAVKGLQPLMQFSGAWAGCVEFSDTPAHQAPTKSVAATFVNPGYVRVDPKSLELAHEADLLAAAENLSYGEALRRVRQRPAAIQLREPAPATSAMDPESMILAKLATFLSEELKIDYGQALRRCREFREELRAGRTAK